MMGPVLIVSCCVAFFFAVVQGEFLPDFTEHTTCQYYGQTYKVGENFKPNPCTSCHCDDKGKPQCDMLDCGMPACVDAVFDPNECCPVCPSGPNCRTFDGTLINSGEEMTMSNGAVCHCPVESMTSIDWGAQAAVCSDKHQMDPGHEDPMVPTDNDAALPMNEVFE